MFGFLRVHGYTPSSSKWMAWPQTDDLFSEYLTGGFPLRFQGRNSRPSVVFLPQSQLLLLCQLQVPTCMMTMKTSVRTFEPGSGFLLSIVETAPVMLTFEWIEAGNWRPLMEDIDDRERQGIYKLHGFAGERVSRCSRRYVLLRDRDGS